MSLGVPPDWPSPVGPYEGQDKPLQCRDPSCSIKGPHNLTDACDQMKEQAAKDEAEYHDKWMEQLAHDGQL